MRFSSKVKNKWEIVLSSKDIFIEAPSKEELIDLITASLPYREIMSQIVRLAAHVVKKHVYKTETTSWQVTIRDAINDIRSLNTRSKASGVYYNIEEMHQMLLTKWNTVLSWVADESDGQWTVKNIKKTVPIATIWNEIKAYPIATRKEMKTKK